MAIEKTLQGMEDFFIYNLKMYHHPNHKSNYLF